MELILDFLEVLNTQCSDNKNKGFDTYISKACMSGPTTNCNNYHPPRSNVEKGNVGSFVRVVRNKCLSEITVKECGVHKGQQGSHQVTCKSAFKPYPEQGN